MKLHPYYTSQILNELNSSAWFREIVSWAEKHHEKIDGTGYPYSLKSSEIDDGVKVLAYADIITALMEDRPYRGSLSIDETLGIINEKFAKELSVNMFDTILEYKDEINTLVRESQGESLKKYQLSLKE
jgi:HD-GYP domain-containing protein (c-di-GMP phosphodiesterase class II)